jgi:DNA (cytosine-5)-methyltransferase 1
LAACLTAGSGQRYDTDTDTFIAFGANNSHHQGLSASSLVTPTLDKSKTPAVAFALRGREGGAMPEIEGDKTGALRAANGGSSRSYVAFDTTQVTSPHNYSNPKPGDPCHPLAAGAHPPAVAIAAHEVAPALTSSARGVARTGETRGQDPVVATFSEDGTARALTRRHDGSPCVDRGPDILATASAVRRLTPVECERLQGFPDTFTMIPWGKKPADQCPDGPRYKALGNSMAVPVMRWIGERIQMVDDLVSLV